MGPVGEHHGVDRLRVEDPVRGHAGAHIDAEVTQFLGDGPCLLLVQGWQDVRGELDDSGTEALVCQCLSGLDADESGSQDDGPRESGADPCPQCPRITDIAQGVHPRGVDSRDRWDEGPRPRGEHQGVVPEVFLPGGCPHRHLARLDVEIGDLVARAHIEGERLPEAFGGLYEETALLRDLPADEVGQATVGEGDVLPTFKDDDLGRLVQASRTCRATHAPRNTADEDDAPASGLFFPDRPCARVHCAP